MKDVSESSIAWIWKPLQISFSSRAGVRRGQCLNSDVSLEQRSSICWCNRWSDCWSRSERIKPQVELVACVLMERPSKWKGRHVYCSKCYSGLPAQCLTHSNNLHFWWMNQRMDRRLVSWLDKVSEAERIPVNKRTGRELDILQFNCFILQIENPCLRMIRIRAQAHRWNSNIIL